MALTKKQRDKIPSKHFAVPETEQLPIEDEVHTKMAWNMVDKTKGLTDEQRSRARKRILRRAHELGMDTSGWKIPENLKAELDDESIDQELEKEMEEQEQQEEENLQGQELIFSALAMEIPGEDEEHPNRAPFKGILTRLDEPSDNPLQGSAGKRVILPKEVAEKALPSLLGMAIDFTENLDAHDVKQKIGLITGATIQGNAIHIEGFFYSADFPIEVKRIQAEKATLGFSYEAQAQIRSMNDDPLVIKNCVFTGAAVLYKDKAAYTSTSLIASKMENTSMTVENVKILETMQAQIAALTEKLNAAEDRLKLSGGNIMHLIKPHAEALRQCASAMAAAGMGMHPKSGHVAVLHHMADKMEAEAAMGQMPHVYQTSDFYHANADKESKIAANAEIVNEFKKLSEMISDVNTKVTDLEKAKFNAAAAPERKTISPEIKHLIAKSGIDVSGEKTASMAEIDKLLSSSNLTIQQRIQAKMGLLASGRIV